METTVLSSLQKPILCHTAAAARLSWNDQAPIIFPLFFAIFLYFIRALYYSFGLSCGTDAIGSRDWPGHAGVTRGLGFSRNMPEADARLHKYGAIRRNGGTIPFLFSDWLAPGGCAQTTLLLWFICTPCIYVYKLAVCAPSPHLDLLVFGLGKPHSLILCIVVTNTLGLWARLRRSDLRERVDYGPLVAAGLTSHFTAFIICFLYLSRVDVSPRH